MGSVPQEASRRIPKTVTAAELLDMEMPEARWTIPGILPEGVTFLAGKPKLGKSWMALGFSVAVSTGGVALGAKRVEQGDALYLALEDHPRRLKKRLQKLLTPGVRPQRLHLRTRWRRSDEGGIADLEAWLKEHPETRLVVVDTLKMFRPRDKGNRGIYDVDYEAVEPLLKLAHRRSVAILVVHHLRKLEAGDPLDMISGSTGLTGGVDGAMVLKRDRGKQDATLHIDGRDIEESAELALRWDAKLTSWVLIGDAEEYRMSEARREIADLLRSSGRHMSAKEIADELSKDPATVRQTLRRMYNDGQVLQDDAGKYYLDDGDGSDMSSHSSHTSHSSSSGHVSPNGVTGVTGVTPVTGVTSVTPHGNSEGADDSDNVIPDDGDTRLPAGRATPAAKEEGKSTRHEAFPSLASGATAPPPAGASAQPENDVVVADEDIIQSQDEVFDLARAWFGREQRKTA